MILARCGVYMRQVLASDSSLLVVFGETSATEYQGQVLALFNALRRLNDPRIRNLHPAYASLLVDFDPLRIEIAELQALVNSASADSSCDFSPGRLVQIPVCYDPELGPDLEFVARHSNLGIDEVVRRHSAARYVVSFLGFSPGFAYLTGLPTELAVPRHSTPRKHVRAGSVGIAGNQTGVYPLGSPGGWQIIGRSPMKFFDSTKINPTLLMAGDTVSFVPIEKDEFMRIVSVASSELRD